jgi:Zn-dependent peptidase ImmA (M78 family)
MSASYARQLVEKYRWLHPRDIDLKQVARDLEVTIEFADLDGCDGMLQMIEEPKCGIITIKKSIRELGQKRFICAHELGHYETPNNEPREFHCSTADLSFGGVRKRPLERAANEFAAELLMPEKMFVPMLSKRGPSMSLIKELASAFRTTLTATLWRFIELTDDRCALVLSESGRIKYGVPSKSFRLPLRHDCAVDSNSYAADFYQSGRINDDMQSVLASAWLFDSRVEKGALIKEQSVAQPNYNSVLTLLWIDKDIYRFTDLDEEDEDDQEDLDHFTSDGKRWRW